MFWQNMCTAYICTTVEDVSAVPHVMKPTSRPEQQRCAGLAQCVVFFPNPSYVQMRSSSWHGHGMVIAWTCWAMLAGASWDDMLLVT